MTNKNGSPRRDFSLADLAAVMADKKLMESFGDFRSMQHLYQAAIREITTKLDILDGEFKLRHGHNPIHHIESRLKSPQSIVDKLKRYGCPVTLEAAYTNIHDIAGVRVVCCYLDDIFRITELLSQYDDLILMVKKDYITNPKPNGYRSLHLIVQVPVFLSEHAELVPVEIQIRTVAMDYWASLEHQIRYKTNNDIPAATHKMLLECADTTAMLDKKMQALYQSVNNIEK